MNSIIEDSNLPKLAEFKVDEVKPAIDYLFSQAKTNFEKALQTQNPSWQTLLKLEEDDEKISQAFSTISHMNAVCNSKELRESYEYAIAKLTDYYTKLGQNKDLSTNKSKKIIYLVNKLKQCVKLLSDLNNQV